MVDQQSTSSSKPEKDPYSAIVEKIAEKKIVAALELLEQSNELEPGQVAELSRQVNELLNAAKKEFILGDSLEAERKWQEAVEAYERAKEIVSDFPGLEEALKHARDAGPLVRAIQARIGRREVAGAEEPVPVPEASKSASKAFSSTTVGITAIGVGLVLAGLLYLNRNAILRGGLGGKTSGPPVADRSVGEPVQPEGAGTLSGGQEAGTETSGPGTQDDHQVVGENRAAHPEAVEQDVMVTRERSGTQGSHSGESGTVVGTDHEETRPQESEEPAVKETASTGSGARQVSGSVEDHPGVADSSAVSADSTDEQEVVDRTTEEVASRTDQVAADPERQTVEPAGASPQDSLAAGSQEYEEMPTISDEILLAENGSAPEAAGEAESAAKEETQSREIGTGDQESGVTESVTTRQETETTQAGEQGLEAASVGMEEEQVASQAPKVTGQENRVTPPEHFDEAGEEPGSLAREGSVQSEEGERLQAAATATVEQGEQAEGEADTSVEKEVAPPAPETSGAVAEAQPAEGGDQAGRVAAEGPVEPQEEAVLVANSSSGEETYWPEGTRLYTVKKGDTLESIARQMYGSSHIWSLIANANKQILRTNPDKLLVGMQLVIPPKSSWKEARGNGKILGLNEDGTYTVQSGDTLGGIARKLFGTSNRWYKLYELNKDILPQPGRLQVGMVLRLEEGPQSQSRSSTAASEETVE